MRVLVLFLALSTVAFAAPAPLPSMRLKKVGGEYKAGDRVVALVPYFGLDEFPQWINCRVVGATPRGFLVEHLHDFGDGPKRWVVGKDDLRRAPR